MLRVTVSLMMTLALVAAGFYLGTLVIDTAAGVQQPEMQTEPITLAQTEGPLTLTDLEQSYAQVYEQVSPSVVAISIARRTGFSEFSDEIEGSGSGFVIDNQGHVMTNYHVVQGAAEIEVNFLDGTITRAEIVGLDADSDLAVLRVDVPADRLYPVTFGTVDDLVIGQTVLAIGSPFGQRWTLTSGIVSALERDIQGLGGYRIGSAIQTDAPINPGNSGGPLLNLAGEVIGVNSQIISRTRSSSGVGFAVPSDLAVRVAEELIANGEVGYSFLGIRGLDVNLNIIEALDLANNQRGMVISDVEPGTPAARAGMRSASTNDQGQLAAADIIVAVDGRPITGFSSLISWLAIDTRPGDTVTMTILRNGDEIDMEVTLGSRR